MVIAVPHDSFSQSQRPKHLRSQRVRVLVEHIKFLLGIHVVLSNHSHLSSPTSIFAMHRLHVKLGTASFAPSKSVGHHIARSPLQTSAFQFPTLQRQTSVPPTPRHFRATGNYGRPTRSSCYLDSRPQVRRQALRLIFRRR